MGVKEKIVGDVAIMTLSGKLMGGKETSEVYEHLKGMVADKIRKVVVDLSKVKWLNSQGIGMLMACYTALKNVDGKLVIAGATEKVNSILMLTQLLTIFEHFDTVDRAVASFKE